MQLTWSYIIGAKKNFFIYSTSSSIIQANDSVINAHLAKFGHVNPSVERAGREVGTGGDEELNIGVMNVMSGVRALQRSDWVIAMVSEINWQ